MGFPGGSDGKESAGYVGDLGSTPGSGRSPVEVYGNPLHYSCLENPMDVAGYSPRGRKESEVTEPVSRAQLLGGEEPMDMQLRSPWKPSTPNGSQGPASIFQDEPEIQSKTQKVYLRHVIVSPLSLLLLQLDGDTSHRASLNPLHQMCDVATKRPKNTHWSPRYTARLDVQVGVSVLFPQ